MEGVDASLLVRLEDEAEARILVAQLSRNELGRDGVTVANVEQLDIDQAVKKQLKSWGNGWR